jgi:murein endopeptidase
VLLGVSRTSGRLSAVLFSVLAFAVTAAVLVLPVPPAAPAVEWRDSEARGLPWNGTLVAGVGLPVEGEHYFTWNPERRETPSRPARLYATDRLVRLVLRIVADYARAHPDAPRLGIGDLSRPRGGPFGPKHSSHQNGLDVDVYYPRLDGRERPAAHPRQIDRRLAQDLVDRFVRVGAVRVFVGPATRLRGPPRIVQELWNHDNHLHARIRGS